VIILELRYAAWRLRHEGFFDASLAFDEVANAMLGKHPGAPSFQVAKQSLEREGFFSLVSWDRPVRVGVFSFSRAQVIGRPPFYTQVFINLETSGAPGIG
jgi:hypothetical protein